MGFTISKLLSVLIAAVSFSAAVTPAKTEANAEEQTKAAETKAVKEHQKEAKK